MADEVYSGVLNLDKPVGITSYDVVRHVRRVSDMRRVGHAGTLDPLASGVLVVCLGRATRLVEYVMARPKVYETTIRLGQETTTYDGEGEVAAERPFSHITTAEIEEALADFRGQIRQQPPLYSAVKKGGKPLYKLARAGQEVERPWREVTVYRLELLAWQPPYLQLRVRCGAGTYIRSLAHDLGRQLGCGGYVSELRRLAVGDFTVETAVSLEDLTPETWDSYLLPPDQAIIHFPPLSVSTEASQKLQQGQRAPRHPGDPEAELARAYDSDGRFLGVVTDAGDAWQPRKMFLSR